MDQVLVSVFCIGLIVFLALTIADTSLSAKDEVASAWSQMEKTRWERVHTSITPIDEGTVVSGQGAHINWVVENNGSVSISADWTSWDVVMDWYNSAKDPYIKRFTYTTNNPPGDEEWTVEGIWIDYESETPEESNPNRLDPGEQLEIHAKTASPVKVNEVHRVTICTPTGATAQIMFTR